MKQIERAPKWYDDEFYNEAVKLRKTVDVDGVVAQMNELSVLG